MKTVTSFSASFLTTLLLTSALPSCNAAMVAEEAPALVSVEWVLAEGEDAPSVDDGRWRLLAFFAPT